MYVPEHSDTYIFEVSGDEYSDAEIVLYDSSFKIIKSSSGGKVSS